LREGPPLTDNSGGASAPGGRVSYVIAAYALVIATLVGYGLHVQAQRRALLRRPPADPIDSR
jgi:hypothetical protein